MTPRQRWTMIAAILGSSIVFLDSTIVHVALPTGFYNDLAGRIRVIDPSDPHLRAMIAPLNRPPSSTPPALVEAIREASTDAFRLALIVAATLLAAGAAVNGVGLRGPDE
jgi:hypothetical protein